MRLSGMPLTLVAYPARTTTNPRFDRIDLGPLDRIFLPPTLTGLLDDPPLGSVEFLEDDNRGAVSPEPVATLDGLPFHLSVKGVGSTVDPFSPRPLDARSAADLSDDADVRARLLRPRVPPPAGEPDRVITGELWLRGSPYGGQGLEHASIALDVARRAELTSIHGFRIAPVVKVAHFPDGLEDRLRSLHWYRRFPGRFAQELRLVPSNVRVYFHARSTLGNDIRQVFDRFGLVDPGAAIRFETAFIRTTLAMLTLFARSLRCDAARARYIGLDFHDVWLDKDAVLAPDGSVYFVDLEGIEEEAVERDRVVEKVHDQIYRSLYEFMFGYEQIEQERQRRHGGERSRKAHFEALVTEALRDDPFLRVVAGSRGVELEVRNPLADEGLYTKFPLVDR